MADIETLIIKAAHRRDLTYAKNFNGRAYALMDADWIGYFDTLDEVLEYFGISEEIDKAESEEQANTRYRKEWFEEVRDEIKELARFHSIEVPMVYGDGTETTDKMVSLEELGRILAEIEDSIGGKL